MKPCFPRIICAGALAAVVLASGCDSAPARSPDATDTVVLSTDRAAPTFEMQLVSAVRVVLPGPEAGAGTAWEVVSNNTRVLEQTGPLKAIPSSGAPGSAATTIASFYSLKPGRSVLRFVLVRPNEAESVPLAECNLTVHVND